MAKPFDAAHADYRRPRSAGGERRLLRRCRPDQFSVSTNGILVYTAGAVHKVSTQLTWFDRTGKLRGLVVDPDKFEPIAISPDGSLLATDTNDSV